MAIANKPAPVPNDDEPALYAKTVIIHPRAVKGIFRNVKWWAMAALLAIYHLSPFLRWDRGAGAPDQAILLDMDGRRAYFFSIEIWPQEVYYLTGILALSAIMLFLISALAGRIWCGFACWQTVYTDLFVAVERWVVGDRNARIKFDRQPMAQRLPKKMVIWTAWFVISAACGIGFTLFFGDAWQVLREIFTLEAGAGIWSTIAIVGGSCFVLAGWGREQICIYMCPYSRFQAAMFDEHSLLISYEGWRGEPRGSAKRNASFEGRGHCVDCKMCVTACPTGVDIREGMQLGCIGCGLCIDACNTIMDKYGLPRGLITYDSISNQQAREKGGKTGYKLVRSRTMIYAAICVVIAAIMVVSLGTRRTLEVNVLHERAPMFVQLSDGSVRNGYTYKILNMVRQDRSFTLSVAGLDGATIGVIGGDEGVANAELEVKGDEIGTFRLYVSAPQASTKGKATPVTLILTEKGGDKPDVVRSETVFAGPEN